ncbi:ankyrin [Sarocladium strictum]
MDELWKKNEALFRRLYQEERKTLPQVKAIVEQEPYCFPSHPLSIYETRLRDVLKLRKKLKKEDWKSIHYYAVSHGLEPGTYDVILNGTRISPKNAWKEIRRNRYHTHVNITDNGTLPMDVHVWPRSGAFTAQATSSEMTVLNHSDIQDVTARTEANVPQGHAMQTWDAFSAALSAIDACESFKQGTTISTVIDLYSLHRFSKARAIEKIHEILPWNQFRKGLLEAMFQRQITYEFLDSEGFPFLWMPNDGFLKVDSAMVLARLTDTIYASEPAEHLLPDTYLSDQLVLYQLLASLAFRITDGSIWLDDFIAFGLVLRLLPPDLLLKIIHTPSVVMKAVWVNFVKSFSKDFANSRPLFRRSTRFDMDSMTKAYICVIHTVLSICPAWIDESKDIVLYACAWLGSRQLVLQILARGAGPLSQESGTSTFTHVTYAGIIDVMAPLLATVAINAPTSCPWSHPWHFSRNIPTIKTSYFVAFLYNFLVEAQHEENYESCPHFLQSLSMFLQSGADADAPFPPEMCNLGPIYKSDRLNKSQRLSCLDIAFYFNFQAFTIMRPYSTKQRGSLTREQLCGAAAGGIDALDHYMKPTRTPDAVRTQQFLEAVLIEQVLISRHCRQANLDAIRARILRTLLEYGVQIGIGGYGSDIATAIFQVVLSSIVEYGMNDDLREILVLLGQKSISIEKDTLVKCVEEEGTTLLALVKDCGLISQRDMVHCGQRALVAAACKENLEAVSWLLDMGGNINAQEGPEGVETSVIHDCMRHRPSTQVLRRLVELGAKLRSRASDETCARLLIHALQQALGSSRLGYDRDDGFSVRWRFFLEFPDEIEQISRTKWIRIAREVFMSGPPVRNATKLISSIFDELLERTIAPGESPSLGLAIRGGRSSTARALIAQGANIDQLDDGSTPLCIAIRNEDFTLARDIIELGADINMVVNIDGWSRRHLDALGDACWQERLSHQDGWNCRDTIGLLLSKGANLTASHVPIPFRPWFEPPLFYCALLGSLEVATILMQKGANPNMVWVQSHHSTGHEELWTHVASTALDTSASMNRLDMSQLLLKAGGLSADPGTTGYDGAIKNATEAGFRAITDLIRQHLYEIEENFRDLKGYRGQHQHEINVVQTEAADLLRRATAAEGTLEAHRKATEG